MAAFNDGTCPKCGAKVAWMGKLSERPPCSECGHQLDTTDLKRVEEQLERDRKKLDEEWGEEIAKSHPKLERGMVWCRKCGRSLKVNAAKRLQGGWPKCCGETMTIDAVTSNLR